MTYQEELINQLMRDYETAVINHDVSPSVAHAQSLSKARHDLIAFINEAKKNAS